MSRDVLPRRLLVRFLAALTLAVSACRAETDGKEGPMTAKLTCEAMAGVDQRHLDGLCAALRAQTAPDTGPMLLVLISADRMGMRARLDHRNGTTTRRGAEIAFDVMDRDLNPSDYQQFAASLLRFSQ